MNIYSLLDQMEELTEELKQAAAMLHDENERRKMKEFHPRYSSINELIRYQLKTITMVMMESCDED